MNSIYSRYTVVKGSVQKTAAQTMCSGPDHFKLLQCLDSGLDALGGDLGLFGVAESGQAEVALAALTEAHARGQQGRIDRLRVLDCHGRGDLSRGSLV